MKYILLLFTFFCVNSTAQNYNVVENELLRSGNVLIKRLMTYDGDAKGNPYLNEDFQKGKIIFNNGKEYEALIRLNVSEQKFEIRKDKNVQPSAIEINKSVIVEIGDKKYKLHSFNLGSDINTIGILEECLIDKNYSLYFFPQKKLEMEKKPQITAPTTGYSKPPRPEWKNNSSFIVFYKDKAYELPNSHKKVLALKLFDDKLYKKYRKSAKLNLKKKESLIGLLTYLNSSF